MSSVCSFPLLVNNNPEPPKVRKRGAKPADPVGTHELVDPVLQEFPSPNSPLHNHGLQTIRKTMGNNAFLVMTELGTHASQFQLSPARVADLAGLSRTACNKAIQQLVLGGFIERVECRKAGRRFGHVLHSRLEGNVRKLDGFVTHFSVDANTKEAAARRVRKKEIRDANNPSNPDRPKKGRKRKTQQ